MKQQEMDFYDVKSTMKAQAAIEYLMTYGWMLVAVSVVGGAAWQTMGFQCVPSVSGFEGQNVHVQDFGLASENTMLLALENNGREDAEIDAVTVNATDAGEIRVSDFVVGPGSTESLSVGGGGFTGSEECSEFDLQIEYDYGPLDSIETQGTIVAPIDTANQPGGFNEVLAETD